MHPAPSIVLFTTAAGAGYGMLFWLGLTALTGRLPGGTWLALVAGGLALGLVTLGLLASTFHLKHPERAWRAVSQWRSSWLSREGVAAIATYVPGLGLVGVWVLAGAGSDHLAWLGGLTAIGAVVTVVCTAMIYASLKPVRMWRSPWTVPCYLGFAAATGALWLAAAMATFGRPAAGPLVIALAMSAAAWALKLLWWRWAAANPSGATTAAAIGLRGRTARQLDPPHTESNYILNEMAFRVARRHAGRLRRLAIVLGLAVTGGLLLVALLAGSTVAVALSAVLAALVGSLAVVIERWLFFAEAVHTVAVYYGRSAA